MLSLRLFILSFFALLRSSDYLIPFGGGFRGGFTSYGAKNRSHVFRIATIRTEHILIVLYIAIAFDEAFTTPFAFANPLTEGFASSRYTFKQISLQAWLGIALIITW